MTIRAVLFDFNGVLLDDEEVHFELFRRVLSQEGIELSREDYYREYLGLDDRGCLLAVHERENRRPDPDALDRLIRRKADLYQDRMRRGGFPFFPGAVELLRVTTGRIPVGIVSGALRTEIEKALESVDLRSRVSPVIGAEDAASKPDPEGYLLGLEGLRSRVDRALPAERVLAVEDSPAGVAAARGAGLQVVGVAQTYDSESLSRAHRVVERVGEIGALLTDSALDYPESSAGS
ncbi:MAG: HAD family phosphatase [Thermoanaerobaculia bacterium]|nr:HAD family phosphatase [Thermoanaerobaculia bacterium]